MDLFGNRNVRRGLVRPVIRDVRRSLVRPVIGNVRRSLVHPDIWNVRRSLVRPVIRNVRRSLVRLCMGRSGSGRHRFLFGERLLGVLRGRLRFRIDG